MRVVRGAQRCFRSFAGYAVLRTGYPVGDGVPQTGVRWQIAQPGERTGLLRGEATSAVELNPSGRRACVHLAGRVVVRG